MVGAVESIGGAGQLLVEFTIKKLSVESKWQHSHLMADKMTKVGVGS